jgi:hypothetical protein
MDNNVPMGEEEERSFRSKEHKADIPARTNPKATRLVFVEQSILIRSSRLSGIVCPSLAP